MGQFSRAGGGGGGSGGGHEDPLKAISHHRHWQRVMRKISGTAMRRKMSSREKYLNLALNLSIFELFPNTVYEFDHIWTVFGLFGWVNFSPKPAQMWPGSLLGLMAQPLFF